MSLLEVMAAATITAMLMASAVVVLRSSYALWQAHDADFEQAENAHAVLRHIVRSVRQASEVTSITVPADDSGELGLTLASGVQIAYTADAPGSVWHWTYPGPTQAVLTPSIDSLAFAGYQADGVTLAADPADVQLVKATATVTMPTGSARTMSCSAWLRSW